uniref:phage integrase SAM-like domain-containing protein n=1 Tax=Alistipes onderdonkii TaxID=328813 RepID=UPI0040275468
MATVSIYYDQRYKSASGKYPLYYRVNLPRRKNFVINTGLTIPPEWWDGYEIIKAPQREKMNRALRRGLNNIEDALLEVQLTHGLNGKAADIKARIIAHMNGVEYVAPEDKQMTFDAFYTEYVDRITHPGTKAIYQLTHARMGWFAEKTGKTDGWRFEDITIEWLKKFEHFLRTKHLDEHGKPIIGVKEIATNTIAISMRNIRAVVNAAIDDELTTLYPFRKFKIKHEETAKRSLTVEELRTLRDYPCEPHQEKYRDIFMLMVYLIGINSVDLFSLKEIRNGRIEYRRSKTGHIFSIKVEPEAQAIIDKYRGKNYLLDVLDTYGNYKDFTHRMNENLRKIGTVERKGRGGKKHRNPLFPKLSTYWARHTWATLAAELDIPDETISLGMGHSTGNRVTNIYINRNQKKVDEANRKVIDYLVNNLE